MDVSWSSEQLAHAVCDLLVAQGHLKEKPSFRRSDRQAKLTSVFEKAGIDGKWMLAYGNPRPLETAVRDGTSGEAWVQQVIDALISMLPSGTVPHADLSAQTTRPQQRRAKSLHKRRVPFLRVTEEAQQVYSSVEIAHLPNSLHIAKQKYPRDAQMFMKYLRNNFRVSDDAALRKLPEIWDLPDAEAYAEMRKIFIGELEDSYDRNLDRKVEQIQRMLGDSNVIRCLDLGTEHTLFLDKMEMAFGGECFGINVEGPSYDQFSKEFDEGVKRGKIMLYDGLHLSEAINTTQQEEMTFDLVTILAVLHHIPDDHLPRLAKEIAKVCSRYVVIKDNDLQPSERNQLFSKIQADVYEGQLLRCSPCYTNFEVSKEKVLAAFEQYFEVEKESMKHNFTGAYWLLLKKR
jgi:septum formation topological specificity factor MinE